ncbi:MAG TPA: thioredoxin family protein [Jiangellaceae bacterium]|nr:thioredoxin family protein [Jiangellaceae bacterium]
MAPTARWLRVLLAAAILVVASSLPAAASDEVTIVFFWGDGCSYCATEHAFLDELAAEVPHVVVLDYEVWQHAENLLLFEETAHRYGIEPTAVPTTFLGEQAWVGFDERIAAEIRAAVLAATGTISADQPLTTVQLPILGPVEVENVPLVVATVTIGLVDGVNPCSLWALSVLLALVLRGGSRARIAAVGGTFLLVTAGIYGAFILGTYSALTLVSHLSWVRLAVAAAAFAVGLVNLKDFLWFHAGPSLSIPEGRKPAIFERMRKVAFTERSLVVAVVGTAGLAAGVAVLELPCTAGFPVLWANLVATADVGQQATVGLLGLYLGIYLLDELIVVAAVVVALRATKLQERHGRVLKLVSGSLMIALAGILIWVPEAIESLTAMLLVPLVAIGVVVAAVTFRRVVLSARERTRV